MQGLADGYFIIPRTLARHLVENSSLEEKKVKKALGENVKEVQKRLDKVLQIKGSKTAGAFHRELGSLLWEYVGMLRNEKGLVQVITAIKDLEDQFWKEILIPGEQHYKNAELEKALRVADFLELGQLMAQDSLERKESCGSHFREEYQSQEQEALRDDENFCHVSVWEHKEEKKASLHKEALEFKEVPLSVRSYK